VDAVIRPLRPFDTPVTRVGPWDPGRTMTNRPARITTPVRNAPMLRFTGLALLLAQHVQLREKDDQQGADHDSRPEPAILHDAWHGSSLLWRIDAYGGGRRVPDGSKGRVSRAGTVRSALRLVRLGLGLGLGPGIRGAVKRAADFLAHLGG